VYDDIVSNNGGNEVVERRLTPAPSFTAGAELGRFEMGSTVVLLFPPGSVKWAVEAGQSVHYGERIGHGTAEPHPGV
jgi:phosphatidylserine decarboxylase